MATGSALIYFQAIAADGIVEHEQLALSLPSYLGWWGGR